MQHESLLERFPLASGGMHKPLWYETVRRMVEHGAGCAAFVPLAGFDTELRECPAADAASAALLAHHLRGRAARVLSDGALDAFVTGDDTTGALRRLGVAVDVAPPLRRVNAAPLH